MKVVFFNYKVFKRVSQSFTSPEVWVAILSAIALLAKAAALLFMGLFKAGLTTKNKDLTSRKLFLFS